MYTSDNSRNEFVDQEEMIQDTEMVPKANILVVTLPVKPSGQDDGDQSQPAIVPAISLPRFHSVEQKELDLPGLNLDDLDVSEADSTKSSRSASSCSSPSSTVVIENSAEKKENSDDISPLTNRKASLDNVRDSETSESDNNDQTEEFAKEAQNWDFH
jgi:hypothetical protein